MTCAERVNAWDTDQEMGRQAVAGQNPCMLQALTALPEGSAITAEHVVLSVEGNNVQVIPHRQMLQLHCILEICWNSINLSVLE